LSTASELPNLQQLFALKSFVVVVAAAAVVVVVVVTVRVYLAPRRQTSIREVLSSSLGCDTNYTD
jgi:hypothetical protein